MLNKRVIRVNRICRLNRVSGGGSGGGVVPATAMQWPDLTYVLWPDLTYVLWPA